MSVDTPLLDFSAPMRSFFLRFTWFSFSDRFQDLYLRKTFFEEKPAIILVSTCSSNTSYFFLFYFFFLFFISLFDFLDFRSSIFKTFIIGFSFVCAGAAIRSRRSLPSAYIAPLATNHPRLIARFLAVLRPRSRRIGSGQISNFILFSFVFFWPQL